jgi:anti-anti-sigma factor
MDRPGTDTWALSTSEETANGCRILVLRGRLGFASAPILDAALTRASNGDRGLILDIAGVDYISSAALAVLQRQADASPLVICGACDAVKLTLDFSGMADRLTLTSSRSDAITQIRARPAD